MHKIMMSTAPPQPTTMSKLKPIPLVPIPTSCFDENHLPSVLHQPDPMTPEAERQARRRTCRFIEEAGQRSLRLPRVAVATATVFFHRFYAKHAFQEHDRFEVAMACLLLAGKTEESPKKLDFVIRECWTLRRKAQLQQQQQQQNKLTSGDDSPNMGGMSPNNAAMGIPSPSSGGDFQMKTDEFVKLKERVLLLERVILHTIGFELSIDHPFKFLIDCAQGLTKKRLLEYTNPTKKEKLVGKDGQPLGKSQQNAQLVQELAQNAMNFANDSLHTSLCLQFSAQQIAMACVYLSGKYSGIGPIGGKTWLDLLDGISVEELTSISVQILELVQPNNRRGAVDSEVAFKAIRKDLDEMAKDNRVDAADGSGSTQPDAKRQKVN